MKKIILCFVFIILLSGCGKNNKDNILKDWRKKVYDYDNLKSIDNILSKCNYKLLNKEFLDNITYHIILYKNDIDKIHNYTYEIIKDTMLEINN